MTGWITVLKFLHVHNGLIFIWSEVDHLCLIMVVPTATAKRSAGISLLCSLNRDVTYYTGLRSEAFLCGAQYLSREDLSGPCASLIKTPLTRIFYEKSSCRFACTRKTPDYLSAGKYSVCEKFVISALISASTVSVAYVASR